MASCGQCHKDTLQGNDLIPSLANDAFLVRWQDRPILDLMLKMRATMPPNGSLLLADQGWLDVVAFLLQSNGFPAGPTMLTPGPQLVTLRIVSP